VLVHGVGLQWTLYLPELDGPMSAPGRGIQTILKDGAGRHYFGGAGAAGGLTRFDGQKWEVLYAGNVLDAALDRDGKPWIVTGSVLTHAGKDWEDELRSLGLPGPWMGIEADRRGVLWIAGEKDLLEWDGSKVVRHAGDVPQFLPPYPAMALGPGGHFWVWSAQGAALWQGERKWSVVGKSTGLPGLRGSAMAVGPKGEVYVGGPWGAAKYDGGSWTQYAPAAAEQFQALPVLPGREVNTLFVDRQSTVWLGTDEGGVATFDGRSWGKLSADDGLASNSVWSIFEDNDAFWFGTAAGVTRFRKQ
jgi:ligand-binding sensor domain-containing protein